MLIPGTWCADLLRRKTFVDNICPVRIWIITREKHWSTSNTPGGYFVDETFPAG